ncbi:MAG TPA: ParB/RepB/Spo0J family partition protein [Planctomycetaceae bacterium]|jgi:ParB family chromosome partitioning protein|nr:ParB/RepB/Spo0J family partition protein [Planctomycetaceae bacterium]
MNERIQYLAIGEIVCERQVRDHIEEASIRELASGLKEVGQLQPIRVRKAGDKYVVLDGERRFCAAASYAGFQTIAAIVETQELDEGQIIHRQLIANCHEELKPMEKARAIARLMEVTGWSASEAGKRLGMSNANVSRLLALLSLPAPIQKQVEDGVIPSSAAAELARVDDPAKQAELAQRIAGGRLTRDGLSGERKAARNGSNRTKRAASRATAVLDPKRSVTVSSEGLDLESFLQILEELVAKVRKIRPRGIGLSTFLRILKEEAKA